MLAKFDDNKNLLDENCEIWIGNFEIYDNDHCPCCNTKGFYTKKLGLYDGSNCPDCKTCYKYICKKCSRIPNKEEPYSRECYKCGCFEPKNDSNGKNNIRTNIRNKLASHKAFDKERFGKSGDLEMDDVEKLLIKQQFKCYVCGDVVLTANYKPYCCYQFSIDRINNDKPHDRGNVLISCYYCNCRHFPLFDQPNKICNYKCHTDKRNITNTRTNIKSEIIENLLKD